MGGGGGGRYKIFMYSIAMLHDTCKSKIIMEIVQTQIYGGIIPLAAKRAFYKERPCLAISMVCMWSIFSLHTSCPGLVPRLE